MDFLSLSKRIHALSLFRSLSSDSLWCAFVQLIDTAAKGEQGIQSIDHYAAFAEQLYARSGNLTNEIRSLVLMHENAYVRRCAQGKEPSGVMRDCLKEELLTLQTAAELSSETVKNAIGGGDYLPKWETEPCDFVALYFERMKSASTKGYGLFAKYHTFFLKNGELMPVSHPDQTSLSELYGYEIQRQEVIENTLALVQGKPAVNLLLYGDAGTGKSSTVKAVVNAYREQGLRLIELKKEQLREIPQLVDTLAHNPLKFILFIDDLSFTRDDDDFSALKAMLEGSVSSNAANVVIYATSNRRHLVRETFSDREGDEIHYNDTMQEMLSLSDRFGLTITFLRPDKTQYQEIVRELAEQYGVTMEPQELRVKADAFAIRKSGYSPRVAKQFIELMKAAQTE